MESLASEEASKGRKSMLSDRHPQSDHKRPILIQNKVLLSETFVRPFGLYLAGGLHRSGRKRAAEAQENQNTN
jgi:hypothetical protein